MDDEWYEAAITACLWAPPSLFGIKAILGKPFHMGKRIVSRRMALLASAIWLSPLPLTLAITFGLLYARRPGPAEAARIAREFTPFVLRLMSFLCLVSGGIVAFAGSSPTPRPRTKKPGGNRKRRRKS